MDTESLGACPSLHVQAPSGVWTAFVTLVPSEAPVKNGSGVGAPELSWIHGSCCDVTARLGVSSENHGRFRVCSQHVSGSEPSRN